MNLKVQAIEASTGKAIAETIIERSTLDACLTDGIAEILAQNNFPPEALQIYRTGLAKDFSRDEVCDELLGRFGLQFFKKEVQPSEVVAPVADRIASAAKNGATAPASPSTPTAVALFQVSCSDAPRKVLRDQLKQIEARRKSIAVELKRIQSDYDFLTARATECRELLKPRPKPTIVRKKAEAHA
jgi:hypothetical protein